MPFNPSLTKNRRRYYKLKCGDNKRIRLMLISFLYFIVPIQYVHRTGDENFHFVLFSNVFFCLVNCLFSAILLRMAELVQLREKVYRDIFCAQDLRLIIVPLRKLNCISSNFHYRSKVHWPKYGWKLYGKKYSLQKLY